MSNITDILYNEIYPALFDKLDEVLPEFEFQKMGGETAHWKSGSKKKVTGEEGDATGKVWVYEQRPGWIIDWTRRSDSTSLWNYIQKRDGLNNHEVFKKLCALSGVSIPNTLSADQLKKIRAEYQKANLLEKLNTFFIDQLVYKNESNKAENLRSYLTNVRKYTTSDIQMNPSQRDKGNVMELGFAPVMEEIEQFLHNIKATEEDTIYIKSILPSTIGVYHTLVIPYRDHKGYIKGFLFRNIDHFEGKGYKYLFSKGLKKEQILFNMNNTKNQKELILVEGQLDAAVCKARGLNNVVAIGGKYLSKAQIELIAKSRFSQVYFALDNEKAVNEALVKNIYALMANEDFQCYVVSLPDGFKDPDELIAKNGIDAFKQCIKEAKNNAYYRFLVTNVLGEYAENEYISDLDRNEVIVKALDTVKHIPKAVDRDAFYYLFLTATENLGITNASFKAKAEELRADQEKLKQEKQFKSLLNKVNNLTQNGDYTKAQDLLDTENKIIKASSLKDYTQNYSLDEFIKDIQSTPDGLSTGIPTLDSIVRIPQGAITVIAGRPSHGKTTFMFNLFLNMANAQPKKKFLFFSFEEEKKRISLKLLTRLVGVDYSHKSFNSTAHIKSYLTKGLSNDFEIEKGKKELNDLLATGRINIYDNAFDVDQMINLLTYLASTEDIGAVFIDYIQKIPVPEKLRGRSRQEQIQYTSNQILQGAAKKLGLPIIIGAQFNREGGREGSKPQLYHLREAGDIEQDANVVLSIFNRHAATLDRLAGNEDDLTDDIKNTNSTIIDVTALKNRDGKINDAVELHFEFNTLSMGERSTVSSGNKYSF